MTNVGLKSQIRSRQYNNAARSENNLLDLCSDNSIALTYSKLGGLKYASTPRIIEGHTNPIKP